MKLLTKTQRDELVRQLGPDALDKQREREDAREFQQGAARALQFAAYRLARRVQSPRATWQLRDVCAREARAGVFAEPTERAEHLDAAAEVAAKLLADPEHWGIKRWTREVRQLKRRAEKAAAMARLAWGDEGA
jgi:hypothetical protein